MCRASEAFKIDVLKNVYKKIWAKNSNAIVKNGLENLNFRFLAVLSLKKC